MGLPAGAAAPSSRDRGQVAVPTRALRVARRAASTASPATTASASTLGLLLDLGSWGESVALADETIA
jgi:hypothetical protein